MLSATTGPGARRLEIEENYDPTVEGYVEDHGVPDYIYVVSTSKVHLIYFEQQRFVTFTRGFSSRSEFTEQQPIPATMLTAIKETSSPEPAQARTDNEPQSSEARPKQSTADPSPAAVGTCFAAGPGGVLVTAHHLVESGHHFRVHLSDGRVLRARPGRSSAPTDLALLLVDGPTPAYISPTQPGKVHPGERVFTLGFPAVQLLGAEPKYSEGSISALSGIGGDATYLQISVPVHPGNSGGPLVTEQGELAGVVVAKASEGPFLQATGSLPQNVGWAVRSEFVVALTGAIAPLEEVSSRDMAIDRALKALCRVEVFADLR
jgi:S1-C subfamily serine protease